MPAPSPMMKPSHGSEAANTHRRDSRFRTPGNHHIGITILDDAGCVANRVRAGRARSAGGLIRTFCVVAHADLSSGQVHNSGRNKER